MVLARKARFKLASATRELEWVSDDERLSALRQFSSERVRTCLRGRVFGAVNRL